MSVGVRVPERDGSLPGYRIVLMHDAKGKVLALHPVESLLNLVAVLKQTDRQLQPIRGEDAARFFGQDALKQQSGQFKLLSMEILHTPELLEHNIIELVEPHSGLVFSAPVDKITNGTKSMLAVTFDEIEAMKPEGSDVEAITKAVEKFTALRVKQRLEDTLGLPSLSPTVKKIIELRSDPEAGVQELVPVVRVDPSLSAQVMSWAASPYYAAPGEVSSIDDAVIRVLGFDLVINMALGTAMGQLLNVPTTGPRGGTPYWLQAVNNASLAEALCKSMPPDIRPQPGLVYLAALLHNFGYLVLAHLFPPHFSMLSRYFEANPHFPIYAIEQQILGITREQIGSWLMSSWDLPEEVCTAIRYQNNKDYSGDYCHSVKLLYLTNRMLREKGLSDGPVEDIPESVFIELGIDRSGAMKKLAQLIENDEDIRELTAVLEDHC
ncbi:MAG: HDOD domain-containing protein [Neptuniibacter sp.]